MVASAGLAVGIIGVRLALAGVVLPAAAILAVTLVAAVVPRLQGILLTAEALVFFVVAMTLIPKFRAAAWAEVPGQPVPHTP